MPEGFGFDRVEGMMLRLAIGDTLGNTSKGMRPGERQRVKGPLRPKGVPEMKIKPDHDGSFPILDGDQALAVSSASGPTVVLGEAGAGKTTVVVERAVWLVRSGVPKERILVMALSRRGADELTTRLAARLGTDAPPVATFHALAARVVRSHFREAGYGQRPRVLSAREAWRHLRQALERMGPYLRTPYESAAPSRTLVALLSDLVAGAAHNVRQPSEVEAAIDGLGRGDLAGLVRFHTRYQEQMRREAILDLEGAGAAALRLLENHPDVLSRYRQQYSHLLVDEFEEATYAQARFARLLGGDGLFASGNHLQGTNSYRGGSPAYLLELASGPGVRVIELHHNHRSAPSLRDVCHRLFGMVQGPGYGWREGEAPAEPRLPGYSAVRQEPHPPGTVAPPRALSEPCPLSPSVAAEESPLACAPSAVSLRRFPHQAEESRWLAREIVRLLHQGGRPEEIGVLFRTGSDPVARDLYRRLVRMGVPVRSLVESTSVGSDPLVKAAFEVVRFLLAPEGERDAVFSRLLSSSLCGITRAEVRWLRRAAGGKGGNLLELALDPRAMEDLPPELARVAAESASRLRSLQPYLDASPGDLLWRIWATFPAFAAQSLARSRGSGVDTGGSPARPSLAGSGGSSPSCWTSTSPGTAGPRRIENLEACFGCDYGFVCAVEK